MNQDWYMFSAVKGQDNAVLHLEKALVNPVHTYLFLGSRGTFVEEAARTFSASLIGLEKESFSRALSQLHPDIVEYEPTGVTYKVKEDVREQMLLQARKTPIEGSKQVLIVHDSHQLRQDSANTLLKSLEEPPDNTHWILIAPSIDSVLPTIRSRSFIIEFERLSSDMIENELVDQGINKQLANNVSWRCSGRLDRARKLSGDYYPLIECSKQVIEMLDGSVSSIALASKFVLESIENISSDVVQKNKTNLETLKKEIKDSGYSDRVGQSIISQTKSRIEAQEKRLKSEMMQEFLDALQYEYRNQLMSGEKSALSDTQRYLYTIDVIEKHKKRLMYNPSDALFLESMFATILNAITVDA